MKYLKKTTRFEKSVSPGSNLMPFKTVCKKVIKMLWPIARKKEIMSVRSCAVIVIFKYNLIYASLQMV